MTSAAPSRLLHVANGTSTTATIEAAGIPGRRSIWADPLYEGPVPGGLSDAELVEVRARYLAAPALAGTASPTQNPATDAVNDLRRWRAEIEDHEDYDEVVLWFEHDLFDQLNLLQLLTWIDARLPTDKRISLICIDSFPGRPDFKGLGELNPEELSPLLETRRPVTGAQFDVARRAWEAFRQPTPEALDELRHEDLSALPYLAAAIARFLQEYPWTIDGLSRTERRLLELADGTGIALWHAFPRMHEGERAYYVTDLSLAALAGELAHASQPMLALDFPDVRGAPHALRGTVELTDLGRLVLARRRDRVATCGIDRWLGGVHLLGGNTPWRWDDGHRRIVRV